VFCYTLWCFYAFSGTNLLTRCHSASSLFSAVFVFQKSYTEIFSELDETKAEPPIFPEASQSPKKRRRGARGRAHPRALRPSPWPRHQGVRPPSPPPNAALPPIYSPRWEKPKGLINFPRNILQATPIVDMRSGGSALPGTVPERGITTGGLLHHHGRLWSDVWVVYLGLRVHSSS
jgi:hypothetical protein